MHALSKTGNAASRTISLMLSLFIFPTNSFAELAKMKGASRYIGTCTNRDSRISSDVDHNTIPCDANVTALHFDDGYTSVQFDISSKTNKQKQSISFVGPRWFNIDDTHMTMVIDQVVFLSQPGGSMIKKPYSGFCFMTLDKPSGSVQQQRCEYIVGNMYNIFELYDIKERNYVDMH